MMDAARPYSHVIAFSLIVGLFFGCGELLGLGEFTNAGQGGAAVSCEPGQVLDCYDGPEGTEGVGPCSGGEGVCNESGDMIVDCAGQVLPAPETCASGVDSDCSGEARDHCSVGTIHVRAALISPTSVAVDGDGAVYLGAALRGPASPGGSCHDGGGTGAYLSKFDNSGAQQWTWCGGEELSDNRVAAVALDGSGIWVGGSFSLSIDLGVGPLPAAVGSTGSGFVLKLDGAGSPLDGDVYTAANQLTEVQDVAVDGSGNLLVGGVFNGSFAGFGTPLTAIGTTIGTSAFVGKRNAAGAPEWGTSLGADVARVRIATTVDDDVIVGFDFATPFDLLGETFDEPGIGILVARLDGGSGAAKWATLLGGNGDQLAPRLAIHEDQLVVMGVSNAVLDFGDGNIPVIGNQDIFFARLDLADGAILWGQHFGAEGFAQYAGGIEIDSQGRIVLAASGIGGVDFGGGPASNELRGSLLARFDKDGAHELTRDFEETDVSWFTAVAVAADDTMVALGGATDGVNFGDGNMSGYGLVVGRFAP